MADPEYVGVAGDWHGNSLWATSAIRQISARLPGESPKIILQAGDLGVWHPPGDEKWVYAGIERTRQSYLSTVQDALEDNDAELHFVDGNHEHHEYLNSTLATTETPWLTPRIQWLERGRRWTWHDRTWLACGGAVSVDKLYRTEGTDWFPQETITPQQEAACIAGGPADVLLSHDAPTDAPLTLMRPAPKGWQPMIPAAEEHREVLQRICVAVKPSYVFHGHYHQSSVRTVHAVWGKCRFTALDMDGTQGNWGVLDVKAMEWGW